MASGALTFTVFTLMWAFFVCFSSCSGSRMILQANLEEEKKTWCVASPLVRSEELLLHNIEFCCKQPGVDCSDIAPPDGPCFYPNTTRKHASVVMNTYYQVSKRLKSACILNGTGVIALTDPSYDKCKYK